MQENLNNNNQNVSGQPNETQSNLSTTDISQRSFLSSILSPINWFHVGLDLFKEIWRISWLFIGSLFMRNSQILGSSFERDPVISAQNFLTKFEEKYGTNHPQFFIGSYEKALKQAKTEFKLVLVYLHSEAHHETDPFCRTILCNEVVIQLLNQHFIVWASNINESLDGYQINDKLQPSTYPFLGVIRSINKPAILLRVEGIIDPEDLLWRLANVTDSQAPLFLAARLDEEERIRNRLIREEQDFAYLQALAQDQEREQKARQEQNQQNNQQNQNQNQNIQQIQTGQETLDHQKDSLKQQIEMKKKTLPEEPPQGQGMQIVIKLPSGARLSRRFHFDNTLQQLYDFVDVSQNEINIGSYHLVSNYPLKTLSDPNLLLKETELGPQALLYVSLL